MILFPSISPVHKIVVLPAVPATFKTTPEVLVRLILANEGLDEVAIACGVLNVTFVPAAVTIISFVVPRSVKAAGTAVELHPAKLGAVPKGSHSNVPPKAMKKLFGVVVKLDKPLFPVITVLLVKPVVPVPPFATLRGVVRVNPAKVGLDVVAMACGVESVILLAPFVTIISLAVPVKVARAAVLPVVLPINNCPLVHEDTPEPPLTTETGVVKLKVVPVRVSPVPAEYTPIAAHDPFWYSHN